MIDAGYIDITTHKGTIAFLDACRAGRHCNRSGSA